MDHRISVVINTLNEESNLPFALRSVEAWSDEIIVVDMHSDDDTREIAKAHGATVHLHERLGFVEPARKFAVERASCPYILILDADELVPEPLSRYLRQLAEADTYDVVRIHRANYIFGKKLDYTGWGEHQDCHARFFRRGMLDISPAIHSGLKPLPNARVHEVASRPGMCLVHFNYLNVHHFIEKLNRYTSIEADQAASRGGRARILTTVLGVAREIYDRYVHAQGYRDGWHGFYLATLMGFYRLAIAAKLTEIERNGDALDVRAAYERVAEELLREYAGSNSSLPIYSADRQKDMSARQ